MLDAGLRIQSRIRLYCKYGEELNQYYTSTLLLDPSHEAFLYLTDEAMEWHDVMSDDREAVIGFFITEIKFHEGWIHEAYILPEYRNMGIMKYEIIKYFTKQKNMIFHLTILKKNVPALKFWKSVFEYMSISMKQISETEEADVYYVSTDS